ncbi:LysR family transcriptional regulator [Martelella radicis]|uniref:DNA-binding transcriptional LysR family regulator n=1 Tax=Martelella radicis TaxID=1397476 RepID=A0A7W6KN17_9HYPH|nr:LysR family transcriptional regulator [Martelella radicis]MBB4124155.1 DNA-binding transcriptional LysR family regulator [Martelella radicis]
MIEKLDMFITLAREQHFGHAAEACGVSQPALSASIKQLEEQLGVLLVLRGSRFQGLTPEGVRVLEWARRLVGDARTMQQELETMRHGLSGHLKVAAIPTALSYVPALTAPFVASNPGVTVSVLSRSSSEILSLLENLEVDVGITYLDNEPVGKVTQIPLYRETYCLVTGADTEQAASKRITWQDVSRLPLCLLTKDMQNRRILDGILSDASADVAPTLESDSIVTLFAHVQTGLWSTIMPESLATTFAIGTLKTIPIVDPVAGARVGLVATHREPHAPLISAVLRLARHLSKTDKPEP